MMNRRGFLGAMLAAAAAPAIVRASSLMPIYVPPQEILYEDTPIIARDITCTLLEYEDLLIQGEVGRIESYRFIEAGFLPPNAWAPRGVMMATAREKVGEVLTMKRLREGVDLMMQEFRQGPPLPYIAIVTPEMAVDLRAKGYRVEEPPSSSSLEIAGGGGSGRKP